MKSIIAKVSVILSIIFVVISICGISSVNCLKGVIPIQKTIAYNDRIIHGMNYGDMTLLPYNLIPLFYVSLLLIILSSTLSFIKTKKIKSGIILSFSIILVVYVLITHNYIWFLILLNIYLFMYIIFDCCYKNTINICIICSSLIVCIVNILKLIQHLNLEFNANINIQKFEISLINISRTNFTLLILWIIILLILIIRDIVYHLNNHKHFGENL